MSQPLERLYTDKKLPMSEVRLAVLPVILMNSGLPQVKLTPKQLSLSSTFQTDSVANMRVNPPRGIEDEDRRLGKARVDYKVGLSFKR